MDEKLERNHEHNDEEKLENVNIEDIDNQQEKQSKEDGKSQRSRRSTDTYCRICFDHNEEEALVTLCLCRGSIGNVHKSCLEKWLATNNAHCCELCGYRFTTSRRPKFKPMYSVYFWMFKEEGLESRNRLCADVTFYAILTPIVCLSIYAATAVSSHYSQPSLILNAATSWISISMTLISSVLSIGYYLWLARALHCHGENWYRWWQGKNEVIVLPPPPPSHRILLETSV